METPLPITFPTKCISDNTVFWNDSSRCFSKNLSEVKSIVTRSDLYLPIQFMNKKICIYNSSGKPIKVHLPTNYNEYDSYMVLDSKNMINVQYLYYTYPMFMFTHSEDK
jgi:hypothetical protein